MGSGGVAPKRQRFCKIKKANIHVFCRLNWHNRYFKSQTVKI